MTKRTKKPNREAMHRDFQHRINQLNMVNGQLRAQNRVFLDSSKAILADLSEGIVEGGKQMAISDKNFNELEAVIEATPEQSLFAIQAQGSAEFGQWLANNLQGFHNHFQQQKQEFIAKQNEPPATQPANDGEDEGAEERRNALADEGQESPQ